MVESPNSPQSEDPAATPPGGEDRRKSRSDKLDEVAALLRGEDPAAPADDDQGDDQPPQGEDPQQDGKLESLDAVAKKLGVKVSDLYQIAIKQQPGPGGEDRSVTIGELADLAKDTGQFELDRLAFEGDRQKREADLTRAREELNAIVSLIPKRAITDELRNAVSKGLNDVRQREQALTLTAIPEWKDEQVKADERKAMSEHLAGYGFAPNYLDQVNDHRTVKYIRENWKRQVAMERALAAMGKRSPSGKTPSKTPAKPPRKPADEQRRAGPRGRADKVAAVADLLRTN